jgi:fructose-specific phosphotransferase system IIC component
MPLHTISAVASTFACVNPSNSAAGNVSIYAIGGDLVMSVGSTNSAPQDATVCIPIPNSKNGGGVIAQTLANLFPGATTPTFIFLRTASQNMVGSAVVSCA